MTGDGTGVGIRLLAFAGLWLFLSGLLSALSFVEVVLVATGVVLIGVAAGGSIWLLRRFDIDWRFAALLVLTSRAVRQVTIRIELGQRMRRYGGVIAHTAAVAVIQAVTALRGLGTRFRGLRLRRRMTRLATRLRETADRVPGTARATFARGVQTYALAAYRLQLLTARAFFAGARLATSLARRAPRPAGGRRQALRLNTLGAQLRRGGEHARAAEQHRVALEIIRDLGDEQAEALTLNNLALALAQAGAEAEAVEHLEQARVVLHELGDEEHEAQVIANLGMVHRRQGHSEKAVTLLHEALEKLPPESTVYRQIEEELVRAS